jgi:hypothetical protein
MKYFYSLALLFLTFLVKSQSVVGISPGGFEERLLSTDNDSILNSAISVSGTVQGNSTMDYCMGNYIYLKQNNLHIIDADNGSLVSIDTLPQNFVLSIEYSGSRGKIFGYGVSGFVEYDISSKIGITLDSTENYSGLTQGMSALEESSGTYLCVKNDSLVGVQCSNGQVLFNKGPTVTNISNIETQQGTTKIFGLSAQGFFVFDYSNNSTVVLNANITNSSAIQGFSTFDYVNNRYIFSKGDEQATQIDSIITIDINSGSVFSRHPISRNQFYNPEYKGSEVEIAASVVDVLCKGGNNGEISIAIQNGVGQFQYTWTSTGVIAQTGSTALNLIAGVYNVQIVDLGLGCSFSKQVAVGSTNMTISFQSSSMCPSDVTNDVQALASGGIAPYTYKWLDPVTGNFANNVQIGLSMGNYQLELQDANQCVDTFSVGLIAPTAFVDITVVNNATTCSGNCDGSAEVILNGGTKPYVYTWYDIAGTPTDSAVQNLCAGAYNLATEDANGCRDTTSVLISCTSTSVRLLSQNNIIIFPNPASDYITAQGLPLNSIVRVTNITGRELVSFSNVPDFIKIDVSSWSSGLYYIKVFNNAGVLMGYEKLITR